MKWFSVVLMLCLLPLLAGCSELRKSEKEIKRDILKMVPIGSEMSDVLSMLKQKNYEIAWVSHEHGFVHQRRRPQRIVGKKAIRAELGDYRGVFFLSTSVTVFFGFDEDGKLIDLWVWKTTDAP